MLYWVLVTVGLLACVCAVSWARRRDGIGKVAAGASTMILSALLSAGVFLLHSLKSLLRIILPKPVYSRILSWWMRFRGKNDQAQESV